MKFFFPDSQDLVDPSFDFETERRSVNRLRHRDDAYAHEVFSTPAYDGLLVSKGIVDGFGGCAGKYTLAQRHRLMRVGAKEFFRLALSGNAQLPIIGDCGAFTYFRERVPPYSVSEVIDFYSACGFNLAVSVDHVILEYQPTWDKPGCHAPELVQERQAITLELARDFQKEHKSGGHAFVPIGVAQGWSPRSYSASVKSLQQMGYDYIAIGGLVPLKTQDILACLESINTVRLPSTRLHLLGVTRIDQSETFRSLGVVSFDSTSPLRQAFKDERDNYYTLHRTYTAVRVPQVEGNPGLQRRIKAGLISQDRARTLEKTCLRLLREYDIGACALERVVEALHEYEELYDPGQDRTIAYREVLEDRPWKACPCDICKSLSYHVMLFRGAERNRRRGFHNLWTFYRRIHSELAIHSGMSTRAPVRTKSERASRPRSSKQPAA